MWDGTKGNATLAHPHHLRLGLRSHRKVRTWKTMLKTKQNGKAYKESPKKWARGETNVKWRLEVVGSVVYRYRTKVCYSLYKTQTSLNPHFESFFPSGQGLIPEREPIRMAGKSLKALSAFMGPLQCYSLAHSNRRHSRHRCQTKGIPDWLKSRSLHDYPEQDFVFTNTPTASFGDQRRRVIWQCYQTWKITFKRVVMMQSLILHPLRPPPRASTQPHQHHIQEFENKTCLAATGYRAELRFCWVTFSSGSFVATSAYSTAFGISNSHLFFVD